jgi:amidase
VPGWPASIVPAGLTRTGLPIGVQPAGPPNSEPMLISLACQLQAMTGHTARLPQNWWETPDLSEAIQHASN